MERVHLILEGNNTFLYLVPETDPDWKTFSDSIQESLLHMRQRVWNYLFGENGKWTAFQLPYGEQINRQVEIIDTIMFY